MNKHVIFISLLQQSTHPSAFPAVARGTPDYQAGDFCHHTVEDQGSNNEERKPYKLYKIIWKTFLLKSF